MLLLHCRGINGFPNNFEAAAELTVWLINQGKLDLTMAGTEIKAARTKRWVFQINLKIFFRKAGTAKQ